MGPEEGTSFSCRVGSPEGFGDIVGILEGFLFGEDVGPDEGTSVNCTVGLSEGLEDTVGLSIGY